MPVSGGRFEELSRDGRAARFRRGRARYWLAAERRELVEKAIPDGELESDLAALPGTGAASAEEAASALATQAATQELARVA